MTTTMRRYLFLVWAGLLGWSGALAQTAPIDVPIPPIIIPNTGGNGSNAGNGGNPNGGTFDKALNERSAEAEAARKAAEDKRKTEQAKRDREEDEKDILVKERQNKLPDAKIWGQQFFRDQSISLFTRSRDVKALSNYLLGEGDELIVTVWGQSDFSANVAVDREGYVDLSKPGGKIPRLYVKGMKFGDASKAIVERLANHMNMANSQHAIVLNYSRSLTINITGEVFNPGSYTIPAANTAFNALTAAGGPSQIGSVRMIKVVSAEQPTRVLDVYQFITNPNAADEFFLRNNDYIYVPLAQRVVRIEGAVKRPYFYELIEGEELLHLLNYAGGLQPDAYKTNIQIKRFINDEERLIDLSLRDLLDKKTNFPLLNGDLVTVAPIKSAYANYVKVNGAVKLPGEYELLPESRVREVLIKAGVIQSSVMERIYIKRLRTDLSYEYINVNVYSILSDENSPENIVLRPLDEIEVKYKSDFIDRYNVQIFGAVRKPGSHSYSPNLSLADVIYMANGIKAEAAGSTVEISRLSKTGDSTYVLFKTFPINDSMQVNGADDFLLEPYDQVFVRLSKNFKPPRNVSITGEVRYPGTYTIEHDGERVEDLIRRAGGFTAIASLEGARMQRVGDGYVLLDLRTIAQKGSPYNYILKEGDAIQVPPVKDLVAISGRVKHPYIREQNEIAEINLQLRLKETKDTVEYARVLAQARIAEKEMPVRINTPFHEGRRARYYIRKYGAGIDRPAGGRRHLVYVRYANGRVRRARNYVVYHYSPRVEKGSIVFVDAKPKKVKPPRERQPVDVNSVIRNTLTQMTGIVMLAIAIQTLTR